MGGALGLNACRAVPIGPVDVGLCGGGQLALLWARAWGPRIQPGQAFAPWVALRLSTHITWPRKSTARLRLMAGTAISMQRPRYVVEGAGELHRISALAPEFLLALVL